MPERLTWGQCYRHMCAWVILELQFWVCPSYLLGSGSADKKTIALLGEGFAYSPLFIGTGG